MLTDVRTFVVDFIYNRCTGLKHFENWTEIKIHEITILTHAQGISGLDENTYVLPIANFYLDINDKIIELSGGKIIIKREKGKGKFILINYESINFPQSKFTIITSAAKNCVVVDSNKETFTFEAITK